MSQETTEVSLGPHCAVTAFVHPLRTQWIGRFGVRLGFLANRVQSIGWGFWSSLPTVSVTTGWLKKLREVVEGPSVLPRFRGPRGWGAPQVCDHFLVHYVQSQSVLQGSSKVTWDWKV